MPSVLALVEQPRLRSRIRAGVRAGNAFDLVDGVRFAVGWRELAELAESRPGSPVFVDALGDDEDMLEDATAFQNVRPASPLILCGNFGLDLPHDLDDDGGVAFAARLIPGLTDSLNAIGWTVLQTVAQHQTDAVARALERAAPVAAHALIARLLDATVQRCRVADLAASLRVSAPTLRRRCTAWRLPSPRRLVVLARLSYQSRNVRG